MVGKELNFKAWLSSKTRPPLLMGVLNTTPDSFSDGGKFMDHGAAIDFGLQMVADGAAFIDVGGESTRPGSTPVDAAEQIRRTVPAISALSKSGANVSIDTTSAAVAEAAIDAGAVLINDISAGRADPGMFALAAKRGVAIVLMHMRGTPQTMQDAPQYADVVAEVAAFLGERARLAEASGVPRHQVLVDVGIGFGKTLHHNLALLRHHLQIADMGYATVLGTSRKGFIGKLTGQAEPRDRVIGTSATVAWGLANGADILRVHDVSAMREVMSVITAIRSAD